MPVQVEFIKEKRAVLQTYTDPIDSNQMRQLKARMETEIFPAAPEKLHIIADFSAVRNLPGTILTSGSNMLMTSQKNMGLIVCVTQNSFVQAMARIFSGLTPKYSFKVVKSLDEAYKEVDSLLSQSSIPG